MKRRVVITGLGAISCLGHGVNPLWEAAVKGESGLKEIDSFDYGDFPVRLAGEVKEFKPQDYIKNRKSIKVMSRDIQLACAASTLAFQDSKIKEEELNPERAGVCMGAGLLDNEVDEIAAGIKSSLDEQGIFQMKKFGSDGLDSLFPLWMLKYLPNMPACHISINHNLQGPSNTITTSCSSSIQAVGESFRIIERGDADVMFAGGAESRVNPLGISRYHLFNALLQGKDKTKEDYSPFDKSRSGFIVGEGSGVVILEELEHAQKRGARIYAEVRGYGSSADYNYFPNELTDSDGREIAMSTACSDADIQPDNVDMIHAHGSGIDKDDLLEARAIHEVFQAKAKEIPVVATKALMGHSGFASGAFQVILSAKMLEEQKILSTLNYTTPDSDINLNMSKELKTGVDVSTILSNAFGMSGQNASLVLTSTPGGDK